MPVRKSQEDKAESTISLQPKRIHQRHRALMRKLIAGVTLKQACEELGFSVSRASLIVNSPLFQAEMERLEEEMKNKFVEAEAEKDRADAADPVRTFLVDSALDAARTLKGALSDANTGTRVNAAKDILDRTGYAKEDKLKARVLVEPSQSLIDVVGRIVEEKGGGE